MGISFQSPVDVMVPLGWRPNERMILARCWGFCFAEEMSVFNEDAPISPWGPSTITALEAHNEGWRLISDTRFCSEENKVLVCPKCVEKLKLEAKRLEKAGWA